MMSFSRSNKRYMYILMIIDVFSKYGWAIQDFRIYGRYPTSKAMIG